MTGTNSNEYSIAWDNGLYCIYNTANGPTNLYGYCDQSNILLCIPGTLYYPTGDGNFALDPDAYITQTNTAPTTANPTTSSPTTTAPTIQCGNTCNSMNIEVTNYVSNGNNICITYSVSNVCNAKWIILGLDYIIGSRPSKKDINGLIESLAILDDRRRLWSSDSHSKKK
eukprot:897591_1